MPRKKDGFSYSRTQLQEIAQEVLDYARHRGASACETDVSEGFGHSVTVRRGEVETIEYNRDKGLGISVLHGPAARATPSSSDFSRAAIRALRSMRPCRLQVFTAEDNCAGLADESLHLARAVELHRMICSFIIHSGPCRSKALLNWRVVAKRQHSRSARKSAIPKALRWRARSRSSSPATAMVFSTASRPRAIRYPARSSPVKAKTCSATTGTARVVMQPGLRRARGDRRLRRAPRAVAFECPPCCDLCGAGDLRGTPGLWPARQFRQ